MGLYACVGVWVGCVCVCVCVVLSVLVAYVFNSDLGGWVLGVSV